MKNALIATLVLAGWAARAHADEAADAKRAEAQRIIDENKAKGCESLKTILSKQAKQCPDEAAAAAQVQCSAAAYAQVSKLQFACADRVRAAAKALKTGTATPAAPAATPGTPGTPAAPAPSAMSDKNSCRALDDAGGVIAQETTAKPSDCMKKLKEAVIKLKCAGAPGASIKYQFVRGAGKPLFQLARCPK